MRLNMRPIGIWVVMGAAICWSTIALGHSPESSDVNLTGKWKGTRRTTGLGTDVNRIQNITFNLIQKGDIVAGSYKCYAGKQSNADCPNPVGKIASGKFDDGKLEIDNRRAKGKIFVRRFSPAGRKAAAGETAAPVPAGRA